MSVQPVSFTQAQQAILADRILRYPTPHERLAGAITNVSADGLAALRKIGVDYNRESHRLKLSQLGNRIAREIVWDRCVRDPLFFILDSRLVTTLDTEEKYDCYSCQDVVEGRWLTACPQCGGVIERRDPNQPFPLSFIHLRDLIRFLMVTPTVAIPKSRRLLITELVCAWVLANVMFRPGQLAVFQADNEKKANYNVSRVHGMWSRLPAWMKMRVPANPKNNGEEIEGKFLLPSVQSKVISIPSRPTKIRMLGPSIYFCDEAAFVPDAFECFGSVRPALQGGCQGIWASTAADGFFRALCLDCFDEYL